MNKRLAEVRRSQMVDDLKRVGALNENNVSASIYNQYGEFTMPTVINYFGGMKKACKAAGVNWVRKTNKVNPQIQRRNLVIKKRVELGQTYEAIAKDYDMTRERVRQISEKFGVKSLVHERAEQRRRELTQEELAGIKKDFSTGMRQRHLAEKYNLDGAYVGSVIAKHGFKYGTYCTMCNAHVTEPSRTLHTWKYCEDCAKKVNCKRHGIYVRKRLKVDPEFKARLYKKNEDWRNSKEGAAWIVAYNKKRAKLLADFKAEQEKVSKR